MALVLIAAVGRNGVIGSNGELPWHIPADLRRFKDLTMGTPIIMGRTTFESIGRPLPGRTSIVMTRRDDFDADGVLVARSVAEALEIAATHAEDGDIYVIGGEQVYRQFLDHAERMELTLVEAEPPGDAFFPEYAVEAWETISVVAAPGPPALEFRTLERRFSRTEKRDNLNSA